MTPQPQQQYIITEDELRYLVDGFVYQDHTMVININALIRSRPSPLTIDTKKCFEGPVYSSAPWKIYRQDAGMGEHDYAVFLNDVFFCRTEHSQTAHEIIRAIRKGA